MSTGQICILFTGALLIWKASCVRRFDHHKVQRLMGHHDPKVNTRYAHLSPSAILKAVNLVGTVVGYRPEPEDAEANA